MSKAEYDTVAPAPYGETARFQCKICCKIIRKRAARDHLKECTDFDWKAALKDWVVVRDGNKLANWRKSGTPLTFETAYDNYTQQSPNPAPNPTTPQPQQDPPADQAPQPAQSPPVPATPTHCEPPQPSPPHTPPRAPQSPPAPRPAPTTPRCPDGGVANNSPHLAPPSRSPTTPIYHEPLSPQSPSYLPPSPIAPRCNTCGALCPQCAPAPPDGRVLAPIGGLAAPMAPPDGRVLAPIGDQAAPMARPMLRRPAAAIAAVPLGEVARKRPRQSLLPSEREWLFGAFAAIDPLGGRIVGADLERARQAGLASDPPHLRPGVTGAQVRSAQRSWRGVMARQQARQQG